MMVDIAVLLGLAGLASLLGRGGAMLGIPDFLGFVVAGALIGLLLPHVAPAVAAGVTLKTAATLGLVALMIGTGRGMAPHMSAGRWRAVAVLAVAILACGVPAFLTAPLVMRAWPDPALAAGGTAPLAYRGTLALAVVVTSVPFITRVLARNRLLGTAFAASVLSTACVVDLVVWGFVPVVIALGRDGAPTVQTVLAPVVATAVLLGSAAVVVRLTPPAASGTRFLLGLVPLASLCLAFVVVLHVGVMVAALIVGLGIGNLHPPPMTRLSRIARAAAALLVPVYFAAVGLHLDLRQHLAPALLVAVFLWSTAIKTLAVTAAAALLRVGTRQALAFGFALNTRGGPGIALASITFDAGVIGGATFVALVATSIATALLADQVLRLTIAPRDPVAAAGGTGGQPIPLR